MAMSCHRLTSDWRRASVFSPSWTRSLGPIRFQPPRGSFSPWLRMVERRPRRRSCAWIEVRRTFGSFGSLTGIGAGFGIAGILTACGRGASAIEATVAVRPAIAAYSATPKSAMVQFPQIDHIGCLVVQPHEDLAEARGGEPRPSLDRIHALERELGVRVA